jgi:hypothetical protein
MYPHLRVCRLNVGKVKASVVNTYSWSIERQTSASGVAVTADGYSRKQLGECEGRCVVHGEACSLCVVALGRA